MSPLVPVLCRPSRNGTYGELNRSGWCGSLSVTARSAGLGGGRCVSKESSRLVSGRQFDDVEVGVALDGGVESRSAVARVVPDPAMEVELVSLGAIQLPARPFRGSWSKVPP